MSREYVESDKNISVKLFKRKVVHEMLSNIFPYTAVKDKNANTVFAYNHRDDRCNYFV